MPVFIDETACKNITDSLNFSIQNRHLGVNAYVIMPNHMHAIVFDKDFDHKRLKHTLDDLRKFTGRKMLDHADSHLPGPFGRTFREHAREDRQRKFWQPTIHAEGIYSEKFYRQKFNYIHRNPVRKGLVRTAEAWRFSSASYWMEVTTSGWDAAVSRDRETSADHGVNPVRRRSPDLRQVSNDVDLSAIEW
jgi:REP element-mobilizing transposase RayT